jgi:histone methylation protein DOT1
VWQRALQSLTNFMEDWRLGILTRGIVPTDKPGAVHYATVGYNETRKVLRRLDLKPADTFVDVGAGKGRVLCLAAQHKVQEAIGLEHAPELAQIARRNVSQMRGRQSAAKVCVEAAEDFDYSSVTVLYFFAPFQPYVTDAVLRKLATDSAGRPLRLAFVMESQEQRAVFLEHKWLECYARWTDGEGHPVGFYRTAHS